MCHKVLTMSQNYDKLKMSYMTQKGGGTVNTNKLLGKIKEREETLQSIANKMQISLSALRRKIYGKTQFNRQEIEKMGEILELTNQELLDIFFAD